MPDPMTMLKTDHRGAKKMLTLLAGADPGRERDRLLEELEAALSLHMELEEKIVYPRIAERLDDHQHEEAEVEHRLAREGLTTLRELAQEPGFGAAVDMLKAGLQHHIREEETEILPDLKTKMARDEWMAMGEAIAAAKARSAAIGGR